MKKIVVLYGLSSYIASNLSTRLNSIGHIVCQVNARSSFDNNLLFLRQFFSSFPSTIPVIWFHFAYFVDKSQSTDSLFESISTNNIILRDSLALFESTTFPGSRFAFISSDRVGTSLTTFDESSTSCQPIDAYGLSKSVCESILYMKEKHCSLFHYSIIRCCSVYGPGQLNGQFIPKILTSLCKHKPIDLGVLNDSRSFLYIDDLVDGLTALIYDDISLPIYHFTTSPIALSDLLDLILDIAPSLFGAPKDLIKHGVHIDMVKSPNLLSPGMSDTFTRSILNWKPSVELNAGIESCCQYLLI